MKRCQTPRTPLRVILLIVIFIVSSGFIGIPTIKTSEVERWVETPKSYIKAEVIVRSERKDLEYEKSLVGTAIAKTLAKANLFQEVYYSRKLKTTDADLRMVVDLLEYSSYNGPGDSSYTIKVKMRTTFYDTGTGDHLAAETLDGSVAMGWRPEAVVIIMAEHLRDFIRAGFIRK